MKKYSSRKIAHKVIKNIIQRFLNGEKLTVEKIVQEYFNPKTTFSYMMAKNKVKSWLNLIKKTIYKNERRSFGNINVGGVYGIPTTMGESNYMMQKYYGLSKGTHINIERTFVDLKDRKLLPQLRESKTRLLEVLTTKK